MDKSGFPTGAVRGLELFAAYDARRLVTYREREDLHHRIRLEPIGTATALRFDDVGYFNRVYSPDAGILQRLAEVEAFFQGSPHGCELICPPDDNMVIRRPGWTPGHRYAWLYSRPVPQVAGDQPAGGDVTVRRPAADERILFLQTYLQAFEAAPDRIPDAVRNMLHLFDLPGLDFLMAWVGQQPAAVAMLCRSGHSAVLCAGASLPVWREQGCHKALLSARLRIAAEAGCEEIVSWAVAHGRSHANMQRSGLLTAGISEAWHLEATN